MTGSYPLCIKGWIIFVIWLKDDRATLWQKLEKAPPRRLRLPDFIDQFTTDIRHTPGEANVTADWLSRIQALNQFIDFEKNAEEQKHDDELSDLM